MPRPLHARKRSRNPPDRRPPGAAHATPATPSLTISAALGLFHSIVEDRVTLPPNHTYVSRFRDRGGAVCLLIGTAGITLALLDRLHVVPWELARLWLQSAPLLLLASVLLLLVGGWLTWRSGHAPATWRPRTDGVRFNSLVLYTRKNCCLCDEAADLLVRYRAFLPPPVEVNVDDDPRLVTQFGSCVPVIEIDGKVRFRGRISELLLRRLIDATAPQEAAGRYQLLPRHDSSPPPE